MSELDKLVEHPAEWLRASESGDGIVVSSRIRLARNIEGFPFLQKLGQDKKVEIIESVGRAVKQSRSLEGTEYYHFDRLSELDRQFLLERHLVSREHATEAGEKAVAIAGSEVISIMVLEEDHLRLQTFQAGFNLPKAWSIIDKIDNELESTLHYAFNAAIGYLTACPTNVGTGLRASCMLHLPGLVLTKQVHKVLQALAKLNLAARGLYGEGTQATGNFFQFSNQITLGQKEEEIIDNLDRVIKQIVEHEKEAREYLLKKRKGRFHDQVWRAVGTLKSARVISSSEATQLLSLTQLGMSMKIIKAEVLRQELNSLFLWIQPAHLQKISGRKLSAAERDERRADLIREKLKKVSL